MWEFLERGDFISLTKTWIEESGEIYWKNRSSKDFAWNFFSAKRDNKRGRAKGGILIGVRKSWIQEKDMEIIRVEENLIKTVLKTEEGTINIWSVYNAGNIEEYWRLWEEMDFIEEEQLIIGGDFNIRIGNEGKVQDTSEEVEERIRFRESNDKVLGNGGRRMIEVINKKVWTIANGNITGDEEGEFTFLGTRGSTVIDYVIINERIKEKIGTFKIEI